MPREIAKSASQKVSSPDYVGLVRFLLEPFIEDTNSLHIDCEQPTSSNKIWLRVAFEMADKGKVFGRGGRNIQAVSKILTTAASNVNQSLFLDIYNSDRQSEVRRDSPDPATAVHTSETTELTQKKKSRPRRPQKNKDTF